jgi:hypothetical protein
MPYVAAVQPGFQIPRTRAAGLPVEAPLQRRSRDRTCSLLRSRLLPPQRTNTNFDEFALGCWLPWESSWTRGTPAWVAPEVRDQPANSYHMRLRKAKVNDLSDDLFKP